MRKEHGVPDGEYGESLYLLCFLRLRSALDGRLETRHKEPVVPPGVGSGDRAARIAAQSVGHQPFAGDRALPVAADIATEDQARDLFRR